MDFFDFVATIFLNHMFKVGLYIFSKIQVHVTTYKLISSRLIVGSILFLSQWQPKHASELLKNS
jgi:hypothetical protein